ncbi:MAG: SdrD B-like domain-containing protein [bacterium]
MLTLKTSEHNIETDKNIITIDDVVITHIQDASDHCSITLITKVELESLEIIYQDDSIKDKNNKIEAYIGNVACDVYYDEEDRIILEKDIMPASTLTISYYILDSTNEEIQTNIDSIGIGQAKNGDEVVNIYQTLYTGKEDANNYLVMQSFEDILPTKIKIKHQIPYDLTIITSNNIFKIEQITDLTYLVDTEKYNNITDIYISKEVQNQSEVYDQILIEGIVNTTKTEQITQYTNVTSANAKSHGIYKYVTLSEEIELDLDYEIIDEKEIYQKYDEFQIKFTRNTSYFVIDKPVITILLPAELEYIDSYLEYTSIVDEKTYLSRDKDYPREIVEPLIIENYKETGKNAIRYIFTNQFPNSDSLTVVLSLKIISNQIKLLSFSGYIGNYQRTFYTNITKAETYIDILDLDNDNNESERIVKTGDVILSIASYDYDITLQSKGNQDKDYTTSSITSSGANVDYLLTVTNNNDVSLNNIEIVNILPNINDTYNLNTISRESEYQVYLINDIKAKIITDKSSIDTPIDIKYSLLDPIRFDEKNNTIGISSWEDKKEYTDVQSIKITKDILMPYEKLEITIPTITSLDSKTIANNTIAIKGQLNGDTIIKETNIVDVSINNQNLNINGYVWLDNGNGIYEEEKGLNNIKIYLLDEEYNILSQTLSTPYINKDGYYNFDNLESNNYYIKVDPNIYTFTKKLDSKINIDTKLSDLITLTDNQVVPAGLIEINYPIINAQNALVLKYEEYYPLENIAATDQFNVDITSNIKVIKNTVNTKEKGTYTVVYEVTDDYNLTTIKTIYVTVTDSKRELAKNDLLMSIALQQTAISHILNAEGEKIQKIIKTDNIDDILKTNNSVKCMVNSITSLEQIYQSQISLLKK